MPRGGKREGAGRKPLPTEIKKHKVVYWITLFEKELVEQYIKRLRSF